MITPFAHLDTVAWIGDSITHDDPWWQLVALHHSTCVGRRCTQAPRCGYPEAQPGTWRLDIDGMLRSPTNTWREGVEVSDHPALVRLADNQAWRLAQQAQLENTLRTVRMLERWLASEGVDLGDNASMRAQAVAQSDGSWMASVFRTYTTTAWRRNKIAQEVLLLDHLGPILVLRGRLVS